MQPRLALIARRLAQSVLLFSLLVSNVSLAAGDSQSLITSSVSGRVTDGKGVGVEGVTVFASPVPKFKLFLPALMKPAGGAAAAVLAAPDPAPVAPFRTTTDAMGQYTFAALPAGTYTLTVQKEGIEFVPASRRVTAPVPVSQDFQVKLLAPEIPPTTEVITPATNQYLQSISADGAVFTYSQNTAELQSLAAGDIMVSDATAGAPNGYLRKVTGVTNQAGVVVVETSPAVLEEAVEDGSLYLHNSLTPAQVTQTKMLPGVTMAPAATSNPLTFAFEVKDVLLYDADDNLQTKDDQVKANGKIEFEMDYEFYLNIEGFNLRNMTFVSRNTLRDTLTVNSEVSLDSIKREKILSSQTFGEITVPLGGVPVVLVPVLEVVVGVDGSIKVGISTSVSHELSMRVGTEYVNPAGWRPIRELVEKYTFTPPHPTLEAKIKGYTGARFNLYLYGLAGPYVKITPFLEFKITPLSAPWWALSTGVEVPAGFKVSEEVKAIGKWFGLKLDEYEVAALSTKIVLAQAQTVNHAPNLPSHPTPGNAATLSNTSPMLAWLGSDQDDPTGGSLTYDIFLEAGDTTPDVLVSKDQAASSFTPGTLKPGTTYYWQINVCDEYGWSTAGPVWSFTISGESGNHPPNVPASPSPAQHATGRSLEENLSWAGGDPDGDAVSYDVYFEAGDTTPDVLVSAGQAGTTFDPGTLTANTTYSWQIISRDANGIITPGPMWNFTTGNGAKAETGIFIAAGGTHTCALTSAGGVKCWGWNEYGQLGDGTVDARWKPVDVVSLGSGMEALAAGYHNTCALTSIGGVKCWGANFSGQLGDGTVAHRWTPVDVVGLASGVKALAAGWGHTCALTSIGGVKCWGANYIGQLGDGTGTDRWTPVDVVGLENGVKALAAGYDHTCALTSIGGVKCWGWNENGQLGDGTVANRWTPVDVVGLENGVTALAAGWGHTCALASTSGVKCWGWNEYGQLGDGTVDARWTPGGVVGLTSGVTALAAGYDHTCALTSIGGVKCWGVNFSGQLGDGTVDARWTPVDVVDLTSGVTALAAGWDHTCALTSSGGVKCWGANEGGQLGDDTHTDRWIPVYVIGFDG